MLCRIHGELISLECSVLKERLKGREFEKFGEFLKVRVMN